MGSQVPILEMSGRSDVGCAREHNEDSIAWNDTMGLAMLADGMGGHNAGEVASALAIEILHGLLLDLPGENREQENALKNAVADANIAILDKAGTQPTYYGMGTTLAVAIFRTDEVLIGHVGDSRVYRFRGGSLERLTSDHSLLQELVDGGFMSADEAAESVNKNVITRALGIEPTVAMDVKRYALLPGDVYLLCSDGLTDMVRDNDIAKLLTENMDNVDAAAEQLVATANLNGGKDNISVILIRVKRLAPRTA